jgi:uncharacterized protein YndB with AHSA1/START domain
MNEISDSGTLVERRSDRELVVTRVFAGQPRTLFEAWTSPALFMQWWPPKSVGVPLLSCEMDVRTGGGYHLAFGHDAANAMAFFGKYVDVIANERLVWTNEESADAAVTTVTFEPSGTGTRVTMREFYPSREALDEAFGGMEACMPEQFEQLDELLVAQGTKVR